MLTWFSALTGAAYHVVYALAAGLAPATGGLATAAAIVLFTVGVRLLLSPLSLWALRGQSRLSVLMPQVQELQRRYARQPDRLQAELTALYQREGSGLLSGCLPLLLQLPFLSIMYRLFRSATVAGRTNALLGRDLLGTPLGSHWLSAAGPLSSHGLVFAGLFMLLGAAAWLAARSARQATPLAAPAGPAPAAPAGPARAAVGPGKAGRPGQTGQTGGGMSWLGRVLPYTTLAVAALMPLAAGIYLLTSTCWTLAERAVLRRRISSAAGLSVTG